MTGNTSALTSRAFQHVFASMKPKGEKSASSVDEAMHSTVATASSIVRAGTHGSSNQPQLEQGCIYNMTDCYEKLKAMVPNMPSNRRMSKVKILQHVIDYIQDLQFALESPSHQTPGSLDGSKDAASDRTIRVPLSTISYNR